MNIRISKLNLKNENELLALVSWKNDPEIGYLISPINPKIRKLPKSLEEIKKFYNENSERAKEVYIIRDGQKIIGNLTISINPSHILIRDHKTAWLGLTIGDKSYWGLGVGSSSMGFFEEESKNKGANRVELGVFEFNTRAYKFYKKLGYKEFERISDFTFWSGKWWDDIRMEKFL